MGKFRSLLGLVAGAAALDYGLGHLFFKQALVRDGLDPRRAAKLSGADWDRYIPAIQQDREWLEDRSVTDVFIPAKDGVMLHAILLACGGSNKVVACFHGHPSQRSGDFAGLVRFYHEAGYNVLLVDARAHGQSEGDYLGYGSLDRWDVLAWIKYLQRYFSADMNLILHGISTGATAVLMAGGQKLPSFVKGVVADSAFTCAWDLFDHVLRTVYHLPATPILHATNMMARRQAHYDLRHCNAAAEAAKSSLPFLLIHGDNDALVPDWMCDEIYQNTASPTQKLIVPGAGHGEAYFMDTALYRSALTQFLEKNTDLDF